MPIVTLLVVLLIFAVLFWAIRTLVPALGLPPAVATVLYVILVLVLVLWLLGVIGAITPVVQLR